MKIFISCSSSDEISVKYKAVTKFLVEELSKDNDLVFGCANRGLMGICYREFLKNNRKIIGVCYEMYKDNLKELKLDETYLVKSLAESNDILTEKSDIILFLPGAFGTLTEFMHILESKRTGLHNKDLIIFNISGFYDGILDTLDIVNSSVSKNYNYRDLCKVFKTVDEVENYIQNKKSLN